MIGACYCFMGVDEKVGGADEREDGGGSIHLSDAPVTGPVRDRGRGVRGRGGVSACEEKKKKAAKTGGGGGEEVRKRGSERERGEQAHLYVWLPSAKRSATPGLINSEKRSQSFFSPHTSTHGLAMTFTSFEAKSGSRYSTLQ